MPSQTATLALQKTAHPDLLAEVGPACPSDLWWKESAPELLPSSGSGSCVILRGLQPTFS